MTARELAKYLASLPEALQDLPVVTSQFDRYEELQLTSHPTTELGYFRGEQYMIINGQVYSTRAQGVGGARPDCGQLNLRQTVISL